jgi:hypothetical protein
MTDNIYFSIDKYQFMAGQSDVYDRYGKLISKTQNYCLWMWNGYYYHVAAQYLTGESDARETAAKLLKNCGCAPVKMV